MFWEYTNFHKKVIKKISNQVLEYPPWLTNSVAQELMLIGKPLLLVSPLWAGLMEGLRVP
jgi:hypothetical protein